MVSPSNSLVGLTRRDPRAPAKALERLYPTGRRTYARVFPADDVETAADVTLARQLGLRSVYVLDDGGDPGLELADGFRRAARAQGLPLAGHARWGAEQARLVGLVRRVRHAGADGVFLGGLGDGAGGALVRALRRGLGPGVVLIAPNTFAPADFVWDASHGASAGMYLSAPGLPLQRFGALGRRFLRGFQATQPNVPVVNYAAYAAAATEVVLDAIARSDGTRASVARALLATDLRDGILGPIRFTPEGDLRRAAVTILHVRARDGVSQIAQYEGAEVDRVIRAPR